MGDLWRSQEMQLLSLIIQNDTAHDVISKMGELGLVDFRDVSCLHSAPRAAPSWALTPTSTVTSTRRSPASSGAFARTPPGWTEAASVPPPP